MSEPENALARGIAALALVLSLLPLPSLAEDARDLPPEALEARPAPDIRSIVAPYRFSPPPTTKLAPADEEKALIYRDQLRNQARELEALQSQGRLGPLGRQTLTDTHIELNRVDRVLHP